MAIPKIRFNGYTEDWEQRKFDELFLSFANKNYQLQSTEYCESGKFPIIDQGKKSIIGYSNNEKKVCNKYPSIIFGDHTTELKYVDYPFIIGADGVKTLSVKDGDTLFQYYNLQVNNVQPTGYNRHFSMLREISLYVPILAEQQKIGSYFQNLDNLITLHQRKCESLKKVKKSMLQKMFPKNGESVPEIRFAGFTDDWEQRKLGEVCERVTRKNKNGESDLPLTIASQYGLIDQRDFFNKVVAAKDMSNYYLLKKGEFAYNKSYSNGFDYGSIKRLNYYEQGCLSTLYICFCIFSDDVVSDYLECFFDTLKWYDDVAQICAEGARNHGLLNVDTQGFFDEISIILPKSKDEQSKISKYLNNLDNLITLHQRKVEKLKDMKKSMLQKMFV